MSAAPSALDGDRQAVADGQQGGHEFFRVTQVVDDFAGDDGAGVAAGGVGHLVVPQGMDEGDGAAGAQDAHGVIQVLRGLVEVPVQDDHVVAARGHAG